MAWTVPFTSSASIFADAVDNLATCGGHARSVPLSSLGVNGVRCITWVPVCRCELDKAFDFAQTTLASCEAGDAATAAGGGDGSGDGTLVRLVLVYGRSTCRPTLLNPSRCARSTAGVSDCRRAFSWLSARVPPLPRQIHVAISPLAVFPRCNLSTPESGCEQRRAGGFRCHHRAGEAGCEAGSGKRWWGAAGGRQGWRKLHVRRERAVEGAQGSWARGCDCRGSRMFHLGLTLRALSADVQLAACVADRSARPGSAHVPPGMMTTNPS